MLMPMMTYLCYAYAHDKIYDLWYAYIDYMTRMIVMIWVIWWWRPVFCYMMIWEMWYVIWYGTCYLWYDMGHAIYDIIWDMWYVMWYRLCLRIFAYVDMIWCCKLGLKIRPKEKRIKVMYIRSGATKIDW